MVEFQSGLVVFKMLKIGQIVYWKRRRRSSISRSGHRGVGVFFSITERKKYERKSNDNKERKEGCYGEDHVRTIPGHGSIE